MKVKETTYTEFLHSKVEVAADSGIDVSSDDISPVLMPHQRDIVLWALRGGRRAIFAAFGLGKTLIQLEICRVLLERVDGPALIVCPLGVRQEFRHDAEELLGLPVVYVRTNEEIAHYNVEGGHTVFLTNYERVRDGDIDPQQFSVCSLDEASVLRSFGSKTYQEFLSLFRGVPYKYVNTATPSPNKYKELIHYAGFLEVMDTGQALTRFFQRDSSRANNLTLHPHKEEEFWLWMSTWALFVTKPSDLGYPDTGYDLPEMEIRYHQVTVDHSTAAAERDGQGKIFRDAAIGVVDASREKRDSIDTRIETMERIIAENPEEHFIIWHDLEAERRAAKKALPAACEVYGSLDLEKREQRIIDFSHGREQYLLTKPVLSGCNFQRHCHRAIFLGIGYKFNDFIQAIHRIYRFLQTEQVRIDIIYTESEQSVLDELLRKWTQHSHLVEQMTTLIRKYGLASTTIAEKLARTIGVDRREEAGERFTAVKNDCVLEVSEMGESSVDLVHTSIPFSNHYEYTPSYNDFGHNEDNDRFFAQMDYLTPHLLRVLKPGRVAAIHVKDRVLYGNTTGTGMPTVDPFHARCIEHYMRHGFQYFGMITVVTDVVRENNQTYRLGWTENSKDGTKMGVGSPEYVLLFRKLPTDTSRAYADTPVTKPKSEYTRARWQIDAHAFWRSSGDRLLTAAELAELPVERLARVYREHSRQRVYDYDDHVGIAESLDRKGHLPTTFMVVAPGSWHKDVWDDVNRMRTLNTDQSASQLNNHLCPLQFDVVDRIIRRFTNPGETVLDPFAGLMTVPYRAIKLGRVGIGIELNADYWRDGVTYCRTAEEEVAAPTLFDLEEAAGGDR